jgi:hypothetical protein
MASRNFFITWADPTNPAMGLDFFPPKGSDELHEALREYYPHLKNLQARMQAAVIEFYVEQNSIDAAIMSPQSPEEYFASPNSTSFTSSISTPQTQPLQVQYPSPISVPSSAVTGPTSPASAPVSATTEPPKQADLMTVWTLTSNPDARIHKRRNMTDAEKLAYKQKRLEGACADCKRRRRKCVHSSGSSSSITSSQTSGRRKSKQAKRSTSAESAAKPAPQPMQAPMLFDNAFDMPSAQMDTAQFNAEFDFMDVFDPNVGQDITWDDDFVNNFDFTKDFQLYGGSSNHRPVVPNHSSSGQLHTQRDTSPTRHTLQDFDIDQFMNFGEDGHMASSSESDYRTSQRQSDREIFRKCCIGQEDQLYVPQSQNFWTRNHLDRHRQPDWSLMTPTNERDIEHPPGQSTGHTSTSWTAGLDLLFPTVQNGLLDRQREREQHLPSLHISTGEDVLAAAFKGTASRPANAIYRSSARRGPEDRRLRSQQDPSNDSSSSNSSMDSVPSSPRSRQNSSPTTSHPTPSAHLTVETIPHHTSCQGGDCSGSRKKQHTSRPLTSLTPSASPISYTTLTFSIPTASLTSRLCAVIPSLAETATMPTSSAPSSSAANAGIEALASVPTALQPGTLLHSTFNSFLSSLLLLWVWMQVLSFITRIENGHSNRNTSKKSFQSFFSTALSFFTISSLMARQPMLLKGLSSSSARLSLPNLLSPLLRISTPSS